MRINQSPKFTESTEGNVTTITLGDHAVKIYEEAPTKHCVTWSLNGSRKRRRFPDAKSAKEAARDILLQFREGREELTATPAQKIEHFLLLEKSIYPATLEDAVRYYLEKMPRDFEAKQVKDVVKEMIASREASRDRKGSSNRWVQTLRYRLGKFADRFRCPIHTIQPADVEAFLNDPAYGWSDRTRYNFQQTVANLFNYSRRKGYLERGDSPVERIERLENPASDPKVFHPQYLRRLLKAARDHNPKLLPYIAIGAFAGLRSAEICRLVWEEHVDLDEGVLRLPSEITKTKRRRTVEIHPTLRSYLLEFKGATGPVVPYYNVHKHLRPVAKLARVLWVQNGLRHSCISYGMVINPNAHHWAEQSGHSVAVLQTNYKQLVSKKEAGKWFETSLSSLDEREPFEVSDASAGSSVSSNHAQATTDQRRKPSRQQSHPTVSTNAQPIQRRQPQSIVCRRP